MLYCIQRIRQFYNRLTIQTKFTLCILIAVCIPALTLLLAFSNRFYAMITADTIRTEQQASAQIAPLIEQQLSQITAASDTLRSTDYYKTLFGQPVKGSFTELAASESAAAFADTTASLENQELICAIRIYIDLPAQSPFFSAASAADLFLPMSEAKGTYWYGIFQGTPADRLYCPSFYLGIREQQIYGDAAYITAASLSLNGKSHPCYMAVYYSTDSFTQILSDSLSLPGSVSYIINDREALVASSNPNLSSIYRLNYQDVRQSFMSSNNFLERNVLGEKIYVAVHFIREPEWIMVTVLPNGPLLQKSNLVILKFAAVFLVCTLIAAAVAIWQSRSITTRLSALVQQMSTVHTSSLPAPLPVPVIQDEVGTLIHTYNYMTDRINELMEMQQKTAEELRIAEFNSLQAQINPHFLYNTMDMINWMALQGKTDEISNAVQQLSRFYKLTLSRKKNFSTIANELEHVSIYVQLQNMRYQNAIDFITDLPDELYQYAIPKLTLQPIIENAILHGILEKPEKKGSIVLTGWCEEEKIVLLVSDDGAGIPASKIGSVLKGGANPATSGTNIAVANIDKRLKLFYGESYGLHYESVYGQGTDVTITFPAKLPEETE